MRIVHIIVGLNVGGAELMLKRLVFAHADYARCEQVVISLTDIGKVGEKLIEAGFTVHALGMRSFLEIPRILLKLARLIRTLDPDLVQTWMYHADLLGGLAARFAGKRNVIWGIRGTTIPQGFFSATQAVVTACAMLSWIVPKAIVCCAESARRSHAAKGYASKKFVVIQNGYALSSFPAREQVRHKVRQEFGLGESELVIGIVGRADPLKDHANFMRAAALLLKEHPAARFLMVGRNIEADPSVAQIAADAGFFPGQVIYAGERNDIPECLAAMDVFCLSSRSEGFPNVVCEAMAMSLPCVVTDVGDAGAIVGATGLVVPPADSTALAAATSRMLALGADGRGSMGRMARERVIEKFDISVAARRFRDLHIACMVGARE